MKNSYNPYSWVTVFTLVVVACFQVTMAHSEVRVAVNSTPSLILIEDSRYILSFGKGAREGYRWVGALPLTLEEEIFAAARDQMAQNPWHSFLVSADGQTKWRRVSAVLDQLSRAGVKKVTLEVGFEPHPDSEIIRPSLTFAPGTPIAYHLISKD